MLVWGIIALTALMAFVSLGVDLGRVQLAKTELRAVADAAARYAAKGIADGTAVAKAQAVAAENRVDMQPLSLQAGDVELGNWDAAQSPKFSSSRTPVNAVRVNARKLAARGTAVPTYFLRVLGVMNCDVSASAIATGGGTPAAFIALGNFAVKNNLFVASYDSSVNVNPSASNHLHNGMIGSNGSITAMNNEVVGVVVLGPSGTHNLTLGAPATVLTQPIPTPTLDFGAAPATNPGGVPAALSVTGTMTLSAGVYHFTSISLDKNATLTFTGPATVYVDGSITYDGSGTIRAYGSIPANLKIRQRGAGSVFGGEKATDVTAIADIEAPQTDFQAKNSAHIRGRGVFNDIDAKNNAEFFYDESLRATLSGAGGAVSLVD